MSAVSTRITAVWTFRSARAAGATPATLPLSVIRFSPALASHSTARAGRTVSVPFAIQGAGTAATAKHLDCQVQVSWDRGKTWHPQAVPTSGMAGTTTEVQQFSDAERPAMGQSGRGE
ncbi:hypothetical protein ACFYXS_37740 [Streptomyces sp. NPDC002574]|uniref:hypothetical protein n=1 Tax=Streptomyces sp. NPDC002574 TaxID=3364652 RepID=UPI00368C2A39